MLPRIYLTFLLLGTVFGYGYNKYPGLRSCCGKSKWRPLHGLSVSKPVYGPPSNSFTSGKPLGAYTPPSSSYGVPSSTYGLPVSTTNFGHSSAGSSFSNGGGFSSHGGFSNAGHGFGSFTSPGATFGHGLVSSGYGAPAPVYGPPSQGYGVPVFNSFKGSSHGFSQNLVSSIGNHGLAHQKVLAASADEAHLPAQLLNPFYKNPAIKDALAKHSWFGPGEKHVGDRETDRISRQQIFEVLSNAGLIKKR